MGIARILCVGGSDSGGGAGIQADIKTITMLGGYAMTAITAITAQNTMEVAETLVLSPAIVAAQISACVRDIGVDAIKIGMLGSAQVAREIAGQIGNERDLAGRTPIIFDPVMIATSGAILADREAVAAFGRLIQLATLVTPNLPELEALGGEAALLARGATLLIKGGHGEGETVTDRLVGPDGEIARWEAPRIDTRHTHGTGCTLASAIACGLGQGMSMVDAIARARNFVRAALLAAPGVGKGAGPMGHHVVRGL